MLQLPPKNCNRYLQTGNSVRTDLLNAIEGAVRHTLIQGNHPLIQLSHFWESILKKEKKKKQRCTQR